MASTMAPAKDEVTVLEHATLKVPYELLNKKFRGIQKIYDREITSASNTSGELASCALKSSGATVQEICGLLDGVVQRVSTLKRKAEESTEEELDCSQLCKARLDHLKSYASGDQTEGMKKAWQKTRVDRMLVDHILRAGHYSAAMLLAEGSGIEELVDVEIFEVCQRVEDALRNHDTGPCLNYCHDNRSKLRRLKSTLEFQTRLQDFIELIRQEKRIEAIKYARKHFSSGNEHLLKEIQTAMGLLAFSPSTKCKRYQKLFSPIRWESLIEQFRQENFNLFQLNTHSVLTITLQAGLSSLKTPQCYKPEEFNVHCPVCSKHFNELAKTLPFAHHSQSYLICALSGDPMNEHNPPLVLPNGYVYGQKALKEMSSENDGVVTCPRTKNSFQFSEVKKVYVM